MTARSGEASPNEATVPARSTDGPGRQGRLSRTERIGAAAIGGTLIALGLRRRSLGGTILALVGGWLLYLAVGERRGGTPAGETQVMRSVTVGRPADELYDLWCDPETLTRILGEFAEVTPLGDDRLHLTASGPLGWRPAWDLQIVEDRPGESLRWESLEGTGVPNGGSVEFRPAPGDWGTEVTLRLRVDPPGGQLGDAALAYFDAAPKMLAYEALYRFKSLAETGEIPTLERNPSARGTGDFV